MSAIKTKAIRYTWISVIIAISEVAMFFVGGLIKSLESFFWLSLLIAPVLVPACIIFAVLGWLKWEELLKNRNEDGSASGRKIVSYINVLIILGAIFVGYLLIGLYSSGINIIGGGSH
ncbi:MAG: hypothetical protein LBE62_09060 [Azonexus sp.]|jgi:uncharacterized membrane protein YidH (DUF202 family)|nr:hypothetical protein [Azonexus sp.]